MFPPARRGEGQEISSLEHKGSRRFADSARPTAVLQESFSAARRPARVCCWLCAAARAIMRGAAPANQPDRVLRRRVSAAPVAVARSAPRRASACARRTRSIRTEEALQTNERPAPRGGAPRRRAAAAIARGGRGARLVRATVSIRPSRDGAGRGRRLGPPKGASRRRRGAARDRGAARARGPPRDIRPRAPRAPMREPPAPAGKISSASWWATAPSVRRVC